MYMYFTVYKCIRTSSTHTWSVYSIHTSNMHCIGTFTYVYIFHTIVPYMATKLWWNICRYIIQWHCIIYIVKWSESCIFTHLEISLASTFSWQGLFQASFPFKSHITDVGGNKRSKCPNAVISGHVIKLVIDGQAIWRSLGRTGRLPFSLAKPKWGRHDCHNKPKCISL